MKKWAQARPGKEICLVSHRLQDLITQGKPASILRAVAVEEGMVPLRQYGWNKVMSGFTTSDAPPDVAPEMMRMAAPCDLA